MRLAHSAATYAYWGEVAQSVMADYDPDSPVERLKRRYAPIGEQCWSKKQLQQEIAAAKEYHGIDLKFRSRRKGMVTNAQGQVWDSNFIQQHSKSPALLRAMRPRVLKKPQSLTAPNISGATTLGATLTATTGTWNYQPTSYTYQWMRAGAAIAGATASTHVIVAADQGGNAITCVVTAVNKRGSTSATSNTITVP